MNVPTTNPYQPPNAAVKPIECERCGRMSGHCAACLVTFEKGASGDYANWETTAATCYVCPACVMDMQGDTLYALPCEQCGRRACLHEDRVEVRISEFLPVDEAYEWQHRCEMCRPQIP